MATETEAIPTSETKLAQVDPERATRSSAEGSKPARVKATSKRTTDKELPDVSSPVPASEEMPEVRSSLFILID